MSGKKEEADVRKERGNSKAVLSKGDDCHKFRKKNDRRSISESKDEATSSNDYLSHKTNRNLPKKNLAQNRLKKLRTKLDAEIKLKDKVGTVGISRLLDESVVKVEKSRSLSSKQKLPKISRIDNRGNSSTARNIASERLKKVKKEMQAVIETIQNSAPILEPALDKDSLMEIDEDISETDEKLSNQNYIHSNTEKISLNPSLSLSNNNTNFGDINFKINPPQKGEDEAFNQSLNVSTNDSRFDVIPFINDEIYKIRTEPSYMALHTNFLLDIEMEVDTPGGDLLIVIDTNVFLSHLNIVNYLLTNSSIPSLSSCVLVVPWPVIQEIDYAMKKNNERLNSQARFANNFINDCLKKKNPRFFAQSLLDFKDNFKNAVNVDDFILQYCMKFVSFDKKVILLTNDRNLCNKAMINNLSVFTTKEFVNSFDLSEFF